MMFFFNLTINTFVPCYPLEICYIAIEHGHWNSGFTHWKWWFSIVFCMFTRGFHVKCCWWYKSTWFFANPSTMGPLGVLLFWQHLQQHLRQHGQHTNQQQMSHSTKRTMESLGCWQAIGTLWLCQNSYWKWPLNYSWFSLKNGDFDS